MMKSTFDVLIIGAGAAGIACALELGAEFIHGPAKTTLSWMHKLQLPFFDVSDEHFFYNRKSFLKYQTISNI
ncbi:MAG: hypothetical protein ACXWC9_09525 [Pseudobdellovibrionaceae bacterium]